MFLAKAYTALHKKENEDLSTDLQHFSILLLDDTNSAIREDVVPNAFNEKHRPVKAK